MAAPARMARAGREPSPRLRDQSSSAWGTGHGQLWQHSLGAEMGVLWGDGMMGSTGFNRHVHLSAVCFACNNVSTLLTLAEIPQIIGKK